MPKREIYEKYTRNMFPAQAPGTGGTGPADAGNQVGTYEPPTGTCWLYCVDTGNTYGGVDAAANLSIGNGNYNLALGWRAMRYNPTGDYNIILGPEAAAGVSGAYITQNVVIGYQAAFTLGYVSPTANATGNTVIGYQAGYALTGGYNNVIIGPNAGKTGATFYGNVFIGPSAGQNAQSGALGNLCIGDSAGFAITTGDANMFFGTGAGNQNTVGGYNAAIGDSALYYNQTGEENTAVGYRTLSGTSSLYSHSYNTSIGSQSGAKIRTGSNNVFIGYKAGNDITTGGSNVFIGYQAGDALTTTANTLIIENSSDVTTPLIYGEFDNNYVKINGRLEVTGGIGGSSSTELTISGGVVTKTGSFHSIDTEGDAGTDDLDTISGGNAGDMLIIYAQDSTHDVVAKDGTGNLQLAGDFTMDNAQDTLHLIYDGSNWLELSRSDNGA